MAPKRLTNDTLRAMKARLLQLREGGLQSAERNFEVQARHDVAASSFHDKLFTAALASSGISQATILQRQQKARESLLAFRSREKKALLERGKVIAKEQRSTVRQVLRYRRLFERVKTNPAGLVCLWFPSFGEPKIARRGSGTHESVTPSFSQGGTGENWLHYGCAITDTSHGCSFDELAFFDYNFVWDSPEFDGLAGPISWVQPNGAYSVYLDIGCFNNPGAKVTMCATLHMGQYTPDGNFNFFGDSTGVTILNKVVTRPHGGYVQTDALLPFGREVTLELPRFTVVKGYPVVYTVSILTVVAAVDGGQAELDIANGAYGVNVPSVWVGVEYF